MSADTKFTTGPWLFRHKSDTMHTEHADYPYGAAFFGFDPEFPPSDANLNLIAAAPDMYEALSNGARILRWYKEHGGKWNKADEGALVEVEAALAKARGEDA